MIFSPSYSRFIRLAVLGLIGASLQITEAYGGETSMPEADSARPLRISSLNQCYDSLFAQQSESVLQLQPTAEHGGRVEPILRFQPDLVLANRFNNPLLVSALQAQGQRVERLGEPNSLAQVEDFLSQLEQLSGTPMALNTEQFPQLFAGQRVLMLQANHYSFGSATLWHDLVEALGGRNVAPGEGLVTVLPEQVLRLDPDLIVVLSHGDFALAARNLLHGALAPLLEARAVTVDADLVGCMAQRLDALVGALAGALEASLRQRDAGLQRSDRSKDPEP